MYIIQTKYGFFGPFKNHRLAQRWLETLPADVKASAWTRVLYEGLEWEVIQKVLTDGGSTQTTSDTTSENSGSTPPTQKTSASSKSG